MENYKNENSEETATRGIGGIAEIDNTIAETFIGKELMDNLVGNQQEKMDRNIREFEAISDVQPTMHEATMRILSRNQEEEGNTKLVIDESQVSPGATNNLGNDRNQGESNQDRNQGESNQDRNQGESNQERNQGENYQVRNQGNHQSRNQEYANRNYSANNQNREFTGPSNQGLVPNSKIARTDTGTVNKRVIQNFNNPRIIGRQNSLERRNFTKREEYNQGRTSPMQLNIRGNQEYGETKRVSIPNMVQFSNSQLVVLQRIEEDRIKKELQQGIKRDRIEILKLKVKTGEISADIAMRKYDEINKCEGIVNDIKEAYGETPQGGTGTRLTSNQQEFFQQQKTLNKPGIEFIEACRKSDENKQRNDNNYRRESNSEESQASSSSGKSSSIDETDRKRGIKDDMYLNQRHNIAKNLTERELKEQYEYINYFKENPRTSVYSRIVKLRKDVLYEINGIPVYFVGTSNEGQIVIAADGIQKPRMLVNVGVLKISRIYLQWYPENKLLRIIYPEITRPIVKVEESKESEVTGNLINNPTTNSVTYSEVTNKESVVNIAAKYLKEIEKEKMINKGITEELELKNKDLIKVQKKLTEANIKISNSTEENEVKLKFSNNKVKHLIGLKNEEYQKLEDEAKVNREALINVESKARHLKQQVKEANNEITEYRKREGENGKMLHESSLMRQKLEEKKDQAEIQWTNEKINYAARVQELEYEKNLLKGRIQELEKSNTVTKEELEEAKSLLEELQAKTNALQSQQGNSENKSGKHKKGGKH